MHSMQRSGWPSRSGDLRSRTLLAMLVVAGCAASTSAQHASGPIAPLPVAPPAVPAPTPLGGDAPPASGDEPASVQEARRRAAEDPTRSCVAGDAAQCHWVDLWRHHLTADFGLSAAFVQAHVEIQHFEVRNLDAEAVFEIQFYVNVDWVRVWFAEQARVRGAGTTVFDGDETVLARLRVLRGDHTANGDRLAALREFSHVAPFEAVTRVARSCGPGAQLAPTPTVDITEDGHFVVRATREQRGLPEDHCLVGTVDVESGRLAGCQPQLCRVH